jgi:hypothetical protein
MEALKIHVMSTQVNLNVHQQQLPKLWHFVVTSKYLSVNQFKQMWYEVHATKFFKLL